eukprot:COSAG02_NODE_4696_length_5085_cov_2.504813_2_plen_225_part_00
MCRTGRTKKTPTSPSTIGIRSTWTPACSADFRITSPHWFLGKTEIHSCGTKRQSHYVAQSRLTRKMIIQWERTVSTPSSCKSRHTFISSPPMVLHINTGSMRKDLVDRVVTVQNPVDMQRRVRRRLCSTNAATTHLRNCCAADGGIGSGRSSCGRKRIIASPKDTIFELPPIASSDQRPRTRYRAATAQRAVDRLYCACNATLSRRRGRHRRHPGNPRERIRGS